MDTRLVARRLGPLAFVSVLALASCGGTAKVSTTDAAVDARDGAIEHAKVDAVDSATHEVARDASTVEEVGNDVQSEDVGSDGGGAPDASVTPVSCGVGVAVPDAGAPAGFCLRAFAKVAEPRALAFAPNGDLFVSTPSMATPGGASGGPGAILLLSDDNHDGVAELHTFLSMINTTTSLADVHALALGGGFLYFTTQATVWRVPYTTGQRLSTAVPQNLGLPATFGTGGRWTHGLALSKSGELYASRGVFAQCGAQGGEISTIGATGALTTVAAGFRNPMYMRCHPRDDVCAATELGEDLQSGATEKMLLIHPNTDYGYPCCYDNAVPAMGVNMACGAVTEEDATFPLSDTPFGFDWEPGAWPAPFTNALFVALHGSAYSSPQWKGAAIVYAPTNATTHAPMQDWQPFLTGFGPGGSVLERPADIAFSPDGRLFFADDNGGNVYWIAPTQ